MIKNNNTKLEYQEPKLIAEIGCNHMGIFEFALEMINEAKNCGADIVKFQKRDNKTLLTTKQYNQLYINRNSFGRTYGEHREFLEFSFTQHEKLKKCCEENNIIYSSSVWDIASAIEISSLNPELIKVPSACNNNYELLKYLFEEFNNKIHISVGMTTFEEIEMILNLIKEYGRGNDVVMYACTSGYPVGFKDVCLLEIIRLQNISNSDVGFSGHHLGIAPDIAAYTLGARYIERHFTIDRTLKGTDHAASLEPSGFKKLKRDLISVYESLRYKSYEILEVEEKQREKLKFRSNC